MFASVQSLLETNSTVTLSIPEFAGAVVRYTELVKAIQNKNAEAKNATVGKVIARKEAQEGLMTELLQTQGSLHAYARRQKNGELMARTEISENVMRHIRKTELASIASNILKLAKEYAEGLTGYGVTPDSVASLEARIEGFLFALGSREGSIPARISARETMEELIDDADGTLDDEIDRYMEYLRESDAQFYKEYFERRVIRDAGVRHRPVENVIPAVQPALAKAA